MDLQSCVTMASQLNSEINYSKSQKNSLNYLKMLNANMRTWNCTDNAVTFQKSRKRKGKSVPDLKEFYHVGQTVMMVIRSKMNTLIILPDVVAEFEDVNQKVYQTFEQTGKNLLKATAFI